MAAKSAASSTPLCIGVILFDATHSRVFAIRGSVFEDARELTAAVEAPCVGLKRRRTGKPVYAQEWLSCRAHYTAQLVDTLHAGQHFDALLIAGPRRCVGLLCQAWPDDLRACPSASLKVTVTAGESAILAATLAKTPRLARAVRAQEFVVRSSSLAMRTKALALPSMRLPNPVLAAGAAAARASLVAIAPI
jgi:hypothetical protein